MSVKHSKVSAVPDVGDATLVEPSDWNANHVIDAGTITDVEVAAANKDGAAGTASMRTLGTGAAQAAPGNDSRLSDARTPTAHHASHEVAGGDAVAITHAQTTGQTANDHHAQAHTLASHSTKAHSELTGVGADDHHAQSHTHASHTGIGANDHHNQAHVLATNAALGGDHTVSGASAGQVLRASAATAANFQALAHADLSGVGSGDHHNAVTIGADGEHSLATQVLSGVDATASQKGHAVLGVQTTGGGIETVKAIGNSGSTKTLALVAGTDGNVQTVTNSASCTYTMPSGLTSGVALSFTLIVTNNGAFTATFTGVKWANATAPTLTSGSGKVDIFSFVTTDGGTTWYGFVQQNFA